MDDRKVFELERLKLAYNKQLLYVAGLIIILMIGLIVYVYNVYRYNFSLFIVSIVIMITSIVGLMTIDEKIKLISKKIGGL